MKEKKGDVNDMMCTIPDAARIRCVPVETTVVKTRRPLPGAVELGSEALIGPMNGPLAQRSRTSPCDETGVIPASARMLPSDVL